MRQRRHGQRGNSTLEFAITGVPLIFLLISIVQMAIGMWHYDTLQYAVKATAAYIAHHGASCTSSPNACGIQIKDAAAVMKSAAIGFQPSSITMTFMAVKSDHTTAYSTPVTCTLDNCLTDTTAWPPSGYDSVGSDIEVKCEYLYRSALSMVAPGPGGGRVSFGAFWLPGYSHQFILF